MRYRGLNRRHFSSAVAWSIASWAVPVTSAPSAPEKAKITIAVAGKAALCYLALTVADQLGHFRAEGLDVDIRDFGTSESAGQAAVAGSADVVSGVFEDTIRLQSGGHKFQCFVLQGRVPGIAMGISPKTLPQYQSVADLKGRKIGISTLGSSCQRMASFVLARAGLGPAEVSFVSVGSAAGALSALRTGQIDAMCNVDPVVTMLEHRGECRIVADARTLKGTMELFGGPMPGACLYASTEFVRNNPDTVQAVTHAMVRSLKWLLTAGPSDIIKTVPESHFLGDRAQFLAAFDKAREAISPDGMLTDDGPRTALKVLASLDAGVRSEKIALAQTYTNAFARSAKTRFKA